MKVVGRNKITIDDHGNQSVATTWGAVRQAPDGTASAFLSDRPEHAVERATTPRLDYSKALGFIFAALVMIPGLFIFYLNFFLVFIAGTVAWFIGKRIGAVIGAREDEKVTVVEADDGSALKMLLEGCFDETVAPLAEVAAKCLIDRGTTVDERSLGWVRLEPEGSQEVVGVLLKAWSRTESMEGEERGEARSELLELASDLPASPGAQHTAQRRLEELITEIDRQAQLRAYLKAAVDESIIRAALEQKHEDDQVEMTRTEITTDPLRQISDRLRETSEVAEAVIKDMQDRDK